MPADHPSSTRPRRVRVAAIAALSLATLAACGGGGNGPATSPTSKASPTDDSTDTSTSTSNSSRISVGDVIYSTSLKAGTSDFGVASPNSQDAAGITLSVQKAGGSYAYSTPKDFHGIPDDIAVRVHAQESTPNKLYFGVACRGLDQNNTYLLVVDMDGDYAIVQVKAGNQTLLKQGKGAFTADPASGVTLDVACVTPQSDDKMNRLFLAAQGKELAEVDDSFENVAISNSYALFALSPDTSTGTGTVTLHDLEVRTASSQ
jgi:hypothetical protein